MISKHIDMLTILSNNKIFKFKTLINGKGSELKVLFKDYSDKDILNFLSKLDKEGFLISEEPFKKRRVSPTNYMSVCINWRKIFEEGILDINSTMYKFFLKYPITFAVFESKANYLMLLEYYKFIQPSSLINSLDNLFMMYFTNKDKFREITKADDNKIIVDIYSNLYSYVKTIPIQSDNIYSLETYENLFKESNIKIDVILKNQLYDARDKVDKKTKDLFNVTE